MKIALTLISSAAVLLWSQPSEACGCFTPPDPTVPVVQAGERILFAVQNGEVTAHIQVQYSGASGAEFGWLLPLPSVPTLELGTDELFARLITTTQPRYQMDVRFGSECQVSFGSGGSGGGATGGGTGGGSGGFADAGSSGPPSPLVVQDSVGPYDYAVLRADSKDAMLEWLSTNRYFVPVGTDDSVAPYIRPGGYFLALKLRAGNTTGDLLPVVLRYTSDLGVIPITLTSTGATENMGVQVWMLGQGRAIPRNYAHTVINDAVIDWPSSGGNYNDVIIRAVGEAPGKHTFVTEYAGTSAVMRNLLASPNRFGTKELLAGKPTPEDFIDHLYWYGFTAVSSLTPFGSPVLPGPLKATLLKFLTPPQGVNADTFFANYRFYKDQAPTPNYQPQQMADEIWERVVVPAQNASALFDALPKLTRLYSTISPADMNKDPAFSFNPELSDVSNLHRATMTVSCQPGTFSERSARLLTEQGWLLDYPNGRFRPVGFDRSRLPASLIVELLREEGPGEILVNNLPVTNLMVGGSQGVGDPSLFDPVTGQPVTRGCGCDAGPSVLLLLGALSLLRRRR